MRGGQWQALLLMQALHERGHIQHLLARRGSPLLERARACGIPAGAVGMMAHFPAADVIHAHDARAHADERWRLADDWINGLRNAIGQ